MKIKKENKNKSYYGRIFHLVTPIVIQNLLSAAVGSADVVMLNSVGQSAIAAVSLATQYTNVLFMVSSTEVILCSRSVASVSSNSECITHFSELIFVAITPAFLYP